MPTCEYECARGHRLEKLFSVSDYPDRIVCDFIVDGFLEQNLTQKRCGLLAEKVRPHEPLARGELGVY